MMLGSLVLIKFLSWLCLYISHSQGPLMDSSDKNSILLVNFEGVEMSIGRMNQRLCFTRSIVCG